jgi:two-component system, cell cycle sensor histidine kinase PleC
VPTSSDAARDFPVDPAAEFASTGDVEPQLHWVPQLDFRVITPKLQLLQASPPMQTPAPPLPPDLAKLAHELRTPIGAIVALAEVMRDERFGALGNPRYKGYANDIHQSARHALAVLTAMFDAGPGLNGRADPRGQMSFEPLELNALARGCVSGLQPLAAQSGIHLRTALTPRPLSLRADRRSVKQILLNLLANALKFTSSGGTITVATSAPTPAGPVTKSLSDTFGKGPVGLTMLQLDVRDTGIGMSADMIADVLSRDIDAAPASVGLPLARALAEAHGGHISITSDAGGTTVSVYLLSASPLTDGAQSPVGSP